MSLILPADPQPVTGPLTNTELRATAVPVSGPLTDTQLRAADVKTRPRSENSAYLKHAHGTASVGAGAWATLASVTVATAKKYRLLMAEGDYSDLGALGNNRGIRVRQATVVRATALTGANQPNPDIEGLTLENTSGADETWDIQGRNGDAVSAQTMYGWFSWVEVSD